MKERWRQNPDRGGAPAVLMTSLDFEALLHRERRVRSIPSDKQQEKEHNKSKIVLHDETVQICPEHKALSFMIQRGRQVLHPVPTISTIRYFQDWLDPGLQNQILQYIYSHCTRCIDAAPWHSLRHRRVKMYGGPVTDQAFEPMGLPA